MTDQVPLQAQRGQRLDLGHRLLHVVFAEGALALRGQGLYGLGRLRLGDRQQHRIWPPGGSGRVVQVRQEGGQGLGGHGGSGGSGAEAYCAHLALYCRPGKEPSSRSSHGE